MTASTVATPNDTEPSRPPVPTHLTTNLFDRAKLPSGDAPLVIDRTNGAEFKNPIFVAKLKLKGRDASLDLRSTWDNTNFMDMLSLRNNPENSHRDPVKALETLQSQHTPLANVGISFAVTVKYGGETYALLSKRGDRIMLPSGYVDIAKLAKRDGSSRLMINANIAAELREEILAARRPGHIASLELLGSSVEAIANELQIGSGGQLIEGSRLLSGPKGQSILDLGQAYDELTYWQSIKLRLSSVPDFVPNTLQVPVDVDGTRISARAIYATQWEAIQLIQGGQLYLPADKSNMNFYHAEEVPVFDPKDRVHPEWPSELATIVNRDGMLLGRLLKDGPEKGQLDGTFYNFRDGLPVLHEIEDLRGQTMSEVWAKTPEGAVPGVVSQGDTTFGERAIKQRKG